MRVTHVITRLIVGGAQENTIASVLGLDQKPGLNVELLSGPSTGAEGSLETQFIRRGGKLTLIPELVRPVHPWKDLLALRALHSHFRKTMPDIVHTHSGKAGVLGRIAAARAGVPIILHTIHGPSFGPFQGSAQNLVFRTAEKVAARQTTRFVVVADALRDQYLRAGIGRPGDYIKIPSGFDLEPFVEARPDPELRAHYGLTEQNFVVGKIARLFKLKGHDDLFRMAPELVARCPEIRFLFVGDGAWRGRFEALARGSNLEKHFIFAGLVPPERVPSLIGIMDLVVHLSRREGLARALPQALAAGRPVVTYDCDGAGEVCIDDKTGFLVKTGDLCTFRERILELARNRPLRDRLGSEGQAFVREHFDVGRMVLSLHQLYLELMNAGSPNSTAGT